jgi:hypothetical protein
LPLSWSKHYLFFLFRVHCIALSCSTFQEVSRSIDVTSVKILQTRSVLFLFDNLSCSGINSHISKIMPISKSNCWNQIREMSVFFFLKFKLLWSKTQHASFITCSPLIILYFENRNWPVERLKWLFSMVLYVNFNLWSWVYLLIVCDEVTFLWISKARC